MSPVARTKVRPRSAHSPRHNCVGTACSQNRDGASMSGIDISLTDRRREYILAEFRCAFVKAKLAQLDIEAAATALRNKIITIEEAVAMFWDSEAIHFLGLDLRGDAE